MGTFDWDKVLIGILMAILLFTGVYVYRLQMSISEKIEKIEQDDEETGRYRQVFYDEELKALQKENKALYDSIASIKNEVTYVTQFEYIVKHTTDTVFVDMSGVKKEDIKEYHYANENPNDTLKYHLTLGSTVKPNWYKLDFEINDQFTIVNRKVGDLNETTIQSSNKGTINEVTVYTPKKNRKFIDRFVLGPSLTAGYDPINKNFGVMLGVSVTYDMSSK